MHKIQGWTGLRTAVIALGLVAWTATGATAAPLSYTHVRPGRSNDWRHGHQRDQLRPAEQQQQRLTSARARRMWAWATSSSRRWRPAHQRLTRTRPFQISFLPASYGSNVGKQRCSGRGQRCAQRRGERAFELDRHGDVQPGARTAWSGWAEAGTADFSLPTSTLLLAPSTSNTGTTSAQGLVTFTPAAAAEAPVPEPSTIALFLTTVGGLGLRRYVLSRRRPAKD